MGYWWLVAITISLLAVAIWAVRRKAGRRGGETAGKKAGDGGAVFRKVILAAVILNFGVWAVGTIALHGDAVSGKKENDKYFLSYKGRYTEVLQGTYLYSLVHTWITIGSFPLAIVLLAMAELRTNA